VINLQYNIRGSFGIDSIKGIFNQVVDDLINFKIDQITITGKVRTLYPAAESAIAV